MRVLLVDDEKELLDLVGISLKKEYIVDCVCDANEAKSYMDAFSYDVAIFDRTFHGVDKSRELVAYAKNKNSKCAVLILSAMSSVDNKVEGLDFGADDYLEKPFDIKELRARLLALSRRFSTEYIRFENIEINTKDKTIKKDNTPISLSKNEHSLIFYLISRTGTVASREEIMDAIYENPQNMTQNSVDELVVRVRRKISPSIIKTIKTRGYIVSL